MVYPDVTLSCSGATYGPQDGQDMPLTIDLAGAWNLPRCFFIADGREDPYGTKKYSTGKSGHMKALHLAPYWTAAQRMGDAIALAIYPKNDVVDCGLANLQSHFVLRWPTDAVWLDGQPLELPRGTPDKPAKENIGAGKPLVIRYGTAAVGVRILWSQTQHGKPAEAALVDDGNEHGVARLTLEHASESVQTNAGVALWIRIGSGLGDPAAFTAWRQRFEQAAPIAVDQKLRFAAPGDAGLVGLSANAPFESEAAKGDSFKYPGPAASQKSASTPRKEPIAAGPIKTEPAPLRGVLELDGVEIGKALLDF
jgi:hypothetical protein